MTDARDRMLWSGRFERGPHPEMVALTASIAFDIELLEEDVAATRAHARVLQEAGILTADEVADIDKAATLLLEKLASNQLVPGPGDEDVHTLVERFLTEQLGDTGRKIHAGRSRNDLVATDLRLWCRARAAELVDATVEVIGVITDFADAHADTVMPSYTHLQRAQPVSLAFHLLAHGFALLRDARRFRAAYEASDVGVLGAGAVAGNTLRLDPDVARRELDFTEVFDNAMDAVSDRDFACDLLYAAALCGVHLSRLGEEIVLWTSSEFGFARLDDDWSTGSSMMPQKRNPDLAELVRGRSAGGIADLVGLLTLLKGMPLAYNRDLQEDKLYVFRSVERIHGSLVATARLLRAIRLDKTAMADAAGSSASWATDLAEILVDRGVPFRDAHEAVGKLVADLDARGTGLASIGAEIAKFHPALEAEDVAHADPTKGLAARSSRGGTSPDRVAEQAHALRGAAATLSGMGGKPRGRLL